MDARVRVGLASALLTITLFLIAAAPYTSPASTQHGCASPIPPPIAGSLVPAPAVPGSVLINEVLSLPGSHWNCSETNKTFSLNSDSWVELYNPHNQPYNLYAVHASFDNASSSKPQYDFPPGAAIAPHGYLVLFPDTYSETLLTGAVLRLVIAGVTIDQVTLPAVPVDHSYARIPDGGNTWQITNTPTIDASNMPSQESPTPASSSPNQGSGSGVSGNNGNSSSTPVLVTGTQPAWSILQLPAPPPAATPAISSTPGSSALLPTPVSNGADLPRRILLTVLATGLALTSLWCWRLFHTS